MKYLLLIFISVLLPIINAPEYSNLDECTVVNVYQSIMPNFEYKYIDSYGEEADIAKVLVPVNIETGRYKFDVTRKSDDLYEVFGTNYYLETTVCFEYLYLDEVIVDIQTYMGTSIGTMYIQD